MDVRSISRAASIRRLGLDDTQLERAALRHGTRQNNGQHNGVEHNGVSNQDGRSHTSGARKLRRQSRTVAPTFWRPRSLWKKHALDFAVAAALSIVTAPLLVLLVVIVRLTSRGPAIYTQIRIGQHGRLFRVYKIRSMYHNCEKGTGAVWASRNDGRITPLGKLLRKLYLDELPQLFNILRGQMSLVGPRPERPEITARLRREFPQDYYERLKVRPGITGLAQIRQQADLNIADVRRKLHYDLLYVRQVSVWLDMKIMIGTLLLAFPSKSKSCRRDGLLRSAKPAVPADYSLEQETETAAPSVPQSAASGAHSHRLEHKRAPVEAIPSCQMAGSSVSRLEPLK